MAVGDYVTSEGLKIPTLEKLIKDCSDEQRSTIDPDLNTSEDSPIGQLTRIIMSHFREAWEVLVIAYNGFDPNQAEGTQAIGLAMLTGTAPAPATKSKFTGTKKLRVNLDASKTILAGAAIFHVNGDPSIRFVTTEQVSSTAAGDYFVAAEAEETGPIVCNAGTLTVIATPIVGLNSVINDYDAIPGTEADNDAQLMLRRENELRATGSATVDSLRADILDIELEDLSKPILSVTIFENDTNTTNGTTGNPAHSLECLVYDGVSPACPDTILAQTIWNGKPGGIQLVGNASASATDSTGATQTIYFSRPTIIQIQFAITIEIETAKYAGDAAAKEAVRATFFAKVKPSKTIRYDDYVVALKGVPGVIGVNNLQFSKVGDPLLPNGSNLTLTLRQMGNADTSNMTITTVPGSP